MSIMYINGTFTQTKAEHIGDAIHGLLDIMTTRLKDSIERRFSVLQVVHVGSEA